MPLIHARSSLSLQTMCVDRDLRLLSPQSYSDKMGRPINPEKAEAVLGTTGEVCTYAGPAVYPGVVGFLFRKSVEEARPPGSAVATPFDSGGLNTKLLGARSPDEKREFLRAHQMHVPAYREFLGEVLATFFENPRDYLTDTWPDPPDAYLPDGLFPFDRIALDEGDARRWTFEVRFPDALSCAGAHLEAVFLPNTLQISRDLQDQLDAWETANVEIVDYEADRPANPETLFERSAAYIRGYLFGGS